MAGSSAGATRSHARDPSDDRAGFVTKLDNDLTALAHRHGLAATLEIGAGELLVVLGGSASPLELLVTPIEAKQPYFRQTARFRVAYRAPDGSLDPGQLRFVDELVDLLSALEPELPPGEASRLLAAPTQWPRVPGAGWALQPPSPDLWSTIVADDPSLLLGTACDQIHRHYSLLAPFLPELIALRYGRKAAIQLTVSPLEARSQQAALTAFCRRNGLHLTIRETGFAVALLLSTRALDHYEYDREPDLWSALSNALACSQACVRTWSVAPARDWWDYMRTKPPDLPKRHGALFSYPRCCAAAWSDSRAAAPFVTSLDQLFAGPGPFPHVMNLFLRTTPFHLYKHLPCSPACPETIAEARRLLALIWATNAGLARSIDRYCTCPVLFTDVCGAGIVLDGEARADGASYRGAFCQAHPRARLAASSNSEADCLVFDELYELLRHGDRLRWQPQRIVVEKGERMIGAIAKPPHLAWRLLRFHRPARSEPAPTGG